MMRNNASASLRRWVAAVAALALPLGIAQSAIAGPSLGATVDAPSGTHVLKTLAATGVQVYSCEFDAQHRLVWKLQGPVASLYDDRGRLEVQHFAGPSWRAEDGSQIQGQAIAEAAAPAAGAIPWLLLKATSVGGNGSLSNVRYVRRIDTAGGAAPGTACVNEHDTGKSPYFARYVFIEPLPQAQ